MQLFAWLARLHSFMTCMVHFFCMTCVAFIFIIIYLFILPIILLFFIILPFSKNTFSLLIYLIY